MSGHDVVNLYGEHYAVRDVADAWRAAGSPPINSSGRLYGTQKYLYDNWRAGKPGFYPADNPDSSTQPLAHMRFAALDIDASSERVQALSAQGLVRPYSYEPWHWEARNVWAYPKVYAIPASSSATPFTPETTTTGETDMLFLLLNEDDAGRGPVWVLLNTRTNGEELTYSQAQANDWAHVWGSAKTVSRQSYLNARAAIANTNGIKAAP